MAAALPGTSAVPQTCKGDFELCHGSYGVDAASSEVYPCCGEPTSRCYRKTAQISLCLPSGCTGDGLTTGWDCAKSPNPPPNLPPPTPPTPPPPLPTPPMPPPSPCAPSPRPSSPPRPPPTPPRCPRPSPPPQPSRFSSDPPHISPPIPWFVLAGAHDSATDASHAPEASSPYFYSEQTSSPGLGQSAALSSSASHTNPQAAIPGQAQTSPSPGNAISPAIFYGLLFVFCVMPLSGLLFAAHQLLGSPQARQQTYKDVSHAWETRSDLSAHQVFTGARYLLLRILKGDPDLAESTCAAKHHQLPSEFDCVPENCVSPESEKSSREPDTPEPEIVQDSPQTDDAPEYRRRHLGPAAGGGGLRPVYLDGDGRSARSATAGNHSPRAAENELTATSEGKRLMAEELALADEALPTAPSDRVISAMAAYWAARDKLRAEREARLRQGTIDTL